MDGIIGIVSKKKIDASKESPIKKARNILQETLYDSATEQVAKVPVESYFQWYQKVSLKTLTCLRLDFNNVEMLSDMTGQLISEGKVVSFRTNGIV